MNAAAFIPAQVPPIVRLGMGCGKIGSIGNRTSVREVRRTLALAMDLGVRVFETSDIYGQGDSEREVGRAVARRRDEAIIVTKVGRRFSTKARLLRPFKPIIAPMIRAVPGFRRRVVEARDGQMAMDFSAERLPHALNASLARLRTDHVDALLLHSPPVEVVRDPSIADGLSQVLASGKALRVGIACDDYATLEAACAIHAVSVVELPLWIMDEAGKTGLAQDMHARGIWVIAREIIRFSPGVPPPVAVAHAIAREDVGTAVVGMSSRHHLEQIVAGL